MTLTITINCENEAFEIGGSEVARILRKLADSVDGYFLNNFDRVLVDVNGNKVGRAVTSD